MLGILIGWLIWGRQTKAQGERVRQLEGTLRERDGQVRRLQVRAQDAETRVGELETSLAELEATRATVIEIAPPEPQDLTRIEGIGPKVSSLLAGAGIVNYAQLAASSVERLAEMLRAAGMAMIDPGTWAEQAQLAAEEKWDEPNALQDELKGGRRDGDNCPAQPPANEMC